MHIKEHGFTLIELLVSMVLMLVVVVGVLRFVGTVVVDSEAGVIRQDKSSQTRIALTNMARDVAGAGFEPLTKKPEVGWFSATQTAQLGANLSACTASDCKGKVLSVGTETAQFQAGSSTAALAHDCYGAINFGSNDIKKIDPLVSTSRPWVMVYNQYSIVKRAIDGAIALRCAGNGSGMNRQTILENVLSAQFTSTDVYPNRRMISLCIITTDSELGADGSASLTDCQGSSIAAAVGRVYYKTRIDMATRAVPFVAGQ